MQILLVLLIIVSGKKLLWIFILKNLIKFHISVTLASPYRCGPYEELRGCSRPHCPPSCQCIQGYGRNRYGDCQKCGLNEIYKECGNYCERSCKNLNGDSNCQVLACKAGCFCDDGYVRDSRGSCISQQRCPSNGILH